MKDVRLYEVAPRDGLQSARKILPVGQRVQLLQKLAAAAPQNMNLQQQRPEP